ncbi:hypothetical protein [Euzebya pacifica]|uniref:hypothetical protein n=1 Tax=Euzebya pacifica TaxID=1608957 RepID=UPI0030FC01DD
MGFKSAVQEAFHYATGHGGTLGHGLQPGDRLLDIGRVRRPRFQTYDPQHLGIAPLTPEQQHAATEITEEIRPAHCDPDAHLHGLSIAFACERDTSDTPLDPAAVDTVMRFLDAPEVATEPCQPEPSATPALQPAATPSGGGS